MVETGPLGEGSARRTGIWFLGSLLVLELVRYVFSYYGVSLWQITMRGLGLRQMQLESSLTTVLYVLLGVGLVVTVALAFLVVSRYRAPQSLWLAAVTASALQLGSLLGTMLPVWLLGGPEQMMGVDTYERVVTAAPFLSERFYFAAAIGYPLAAWLGCRLGAAWRDRTSQLS